MDGAKLLGLDALRGAAALAVVGFHAQGFFPDAPSLSGAYLAVDLFFALSGFVLFAAYSRRLDAGMSAMAFMAIRLRRLFPLYAIALALAVILALRGLAHGAGPSPVGIAFGIVFLPTPGGAGDALYPLNPPAWSLFFELFANLVMALTWRRLTLPVLVAITATCGALLVALSIQHGSADLGYAWSGLGGGFARVGFSFTLGGLIYRLGLADKAPELPGAACVAALILLLAMPGGELTTTRDLLLIGGALPVLLILAANARLGPTTSRLAAFGGLASYGVYVLHVPMLTAASKVARRIEIDASHPGVALAFLAAITGIAWLATRFVDQPIRAAISGVPDRQSAQGAL